MGKLGQFCCSVSFSCEPLPVPSCVPVPEADPGCLQRSHPLLTLPCAGEPHLPSCSRTSSHPRKPALHLCTAQPESSWTHCPAPVLALSIAWDLLLLVAVGYGLGTASVSRCLWATWAVFALCTFCLASPAHPACSLLRSPIQGTAFQDREWKPTLAQWYFAPAQPLPYSPCSQACCLPSTSGCLFRHLFQMFLCLSSIYHFNKTFSGVQEEV